MILFKKYWNDFLKTKQESRYIATVWYEFIKKNGKMEKMSNHNKPSPHFPSSLLLSVLSYLFNLSHPLSLTHSRTHTNRVSISSTIFFPSSSPRPPLLCKITIPKNTLLVLQYQESRIPIFTEHRSLFRLSIISVFTRSCRKSRHPKKFGVWRWVLWS